MLSDCVCCETCLSNFKLLTFILRIPLVAYSSLQLPPSSLRMHSCFLFGCACNLLSLSGQSVMAQSADEQTG